MAKPYSQDLRRRAVGTIEHGFGLGPARDFRGAQGEPNWAGPSSDALRSICEAIRAYQAALEPQPPAIDRFK